MNRVFETVYEDGLSSENISNELFDFIMTFGAVIRCFDESDLVKGRLYCSDSCKLFTWKIDYYEAVEDTVPYLMIWERNGKLDKNFDLTIPCKCPHAIAKKLITIIIAMVSAISGSPFSRCEEAKDYMEILNSSYTGKGKSDYIEVGNYVICIAGSNYGHIVEVTCKDGINPPVDVGAYDDILNYDMWDKSNEWKKVYFSGTLNKAFSLRGSYECDYPILETQYKNKIYYLEYDEKKFSQCLETGLEHGFYCRICACPIGLGDYVKSNSDGCLILDYVVKPKLRKADYINIVRNAIRKRQDNFFYLQPIGREALYGEAFDEFFENPYWEYARRFDEAKGRDIDIVRFRGMCENEGITGIAEIIFMVDYDKSSFELIDFWFNGKQKESLHWVETRLIDAVFRGGDYYFRPLRKGIND